MTTTYPTGDDFGNIGPDIDLVKEEIFDSRGNRIDDAYVEQAVTHTHEHLRRGRPSLGETASRRSPQLTIKFPTKLKETATVQAQREGRTVSELVRTAVAEYLKQAA
jgi:predicted HicB family RNase H-like nuclease